MDNRRLRRLWRVIEPLSLKLELVGKRAWGRALFVALIALVLHGHGGGRRGGACAADDRGWHLDRLGRTRAADDRGWRLDRLGCAGTRGRGHVVEIRGKARRWRRSAGAGTGTGTGHRGREWRS